MRWIEHIHQVCGVCMSVELTKAESTRYSRHLLLPEVSLAGQKKMKAARVLVVGAGGLGCPVALYLAASGIGKIGIADFDNIELSNLQRQILYSTDQVGTSKVEAAVERLRALNDCISVEVHETRISADCVMEIIKDYDVVVDGTDNFASRYLLNDACVLSRKPYVYGSIFQFEGQASVFTHESGCYRCIFPEPPDAADMPNCSEAGVLGVLPGVIGGIQATETLKLVLEIGDTLRGRLLLFDALSMRFDEVQVNRNPGCPVCGDRPVIRKLVDEQVQCATDNPQINGVLSEDQIGVEELAQRLKNSPAEFVLLDVRNPEEYLICHFPSAVLIPLRELEGRLPELDKSREIVVHCKSGLRSLAAVKLLQEHGYRAQSLSGGIIAWAEQEDPTMTRY